MWSSLYAAGAAAAANSNVIVCAPFYHTAMVPGCSMIPTTANGIQQSTASDRSSESSCSPSGSTTEDSEQSSSKEFWCDSCKKDFRRLDLLIRHMRSHTGEKPFRCDRCQRTFSRSDHLLTHRRTHFDEKPYMCLLCGYAARRRDVLTRHVSTRHKPTKERQMHATASC